MSYTAGRFFTILNHQGSLSLLQKDKNKKEKVILPFNTKAVSLIRNMIKHFFVEKETIILNRLNFIGSYLGIFAAMLLAWILSLFTFFYPPSVPPLSRSFFKLNFNYETIVDLHAIARNDQKRAYIHLFSSPQ